ncbi:MAG: glutamyl-tRNA reductase [Deltaproteobacteria bacterium]|jgi:glutamyl-tRNA reductase|nr:glutamyl-tRNA reductase [Deltaproteobacteria bacterium]MBK7066004.1 glutamyl-tRNA reductase [Deltaproteobacteria bacterium]MBP6833198.1 glutamyl-tRNA reductase [Deltaproteobacteria bacterium]
MTEGVVVVGLNHRTAPVEARERLAVPPDGLEDAVRAVLALEGVREAVVVATCNRVELYAAGAEAESVAGELRRHMQARGGSGVTLYEHRGEAAVQHAFRVCASLDSLVVGEPQILGQVKEAVAAARSAGALRGRLGRVMARAFQTAKRVRTETGIAEGQVSVASVAVDLARGIFGDLMGRKVLVVGAGKMALGAARTLARAGASLLIANRSFDRAEALAREYGATAHPLTDLGMLLQHVDVAVCSTGASGYLLTRHDVATVMKARRGRGLFLIDIAVPRNVEPAAGDLDSVFLYNVDDLERAVAEGGHGRSVATIEAERVIAEELSAFRAEELAQRSAGPTIVALRRRFQEAAAAELERSLSGKLRHLPAGDRAAVEAMLDALTNKLLHAPTVALKSAAASSDGDDVMRAARSLFALDAEPADPRGEVTRMRVQGEMTAKAKAGNGR